MLNTHIVRLGTHAEKEYLLKAYSWFDETVVNANLVEATTSSSAVFLNELQGKNKTFFIDPVTYAFGLVPDYLMKDIEKPIGKSNLKRTFKGLANSYGTIVQEYAGIEALKPEYLDSESAKDELCFCVLNYQKNKINSALIKNAEFLLDETEIVPLLPARYVIPYFYLAGDLEWLDVNIALANRPVCKEFNAWVVVCLDSLLLDSAETIERIVSKFASLESPGYLIWLADFVEERASEGQIKGLKQLVHGLSQSGKKQVIDMFGGYFSCLLAENGLTGFSHGLGYGERRDITPVLGGGLPPAKYYLPPIHKQIRIDQFVTIASDFDANSFEKEICNCVICKGLLQHGLDYLIQQYTATETKLVNGVYRQQSTPQVYRLTRFHYLFNKSLEFQKCNTNSCTNLVSELDTSYRKFKAQLGSAMLQYLKIWAKVLA